MSWFFSSLFQIPVNGVTERTQDHGCHQWQPCKNASGVIFYFSYAFTISILNSNKGMNRPSFVTYLFLGNGTTMSGEGHKHIIGSLGTILFPLTFTAGSRSPRTWCWERRITETVGRSRVTDKAGQEGIGIYWGLTLGPFHLHLSTVFRTGLRGRPCIVPQAAGKCQSWSSSSGLSGFQVHTLTYSPTVFEGPEILAGQVWEQSSTIDSAFIAVTDHLLSFQRSLGSVSLSSGLKTQALLHFRLAPCCSSCQIRGSQHLYPQRKWTHSYWK